MAQCDSYDMQQSPKIANYKIHATLDHESKIAHCTQTLTWKNTSPDTIDELRLYMYMNSFKTRSSSYLQNMEREMLGIDIMQRMEDDPGYIQLTKCQDEQGVDIAPDQYYIRPTDGNENDESLLEIPLRQSILPGATVNYEMTFDVKLPPTVVRSGYGKNDYFLFVHWFPQLCVYEQNAQGKWGWNSHQFMRGTEFFADFGDYDVTIDAPAHLVIGSSGCRISEEERANRKIHHFIGHDLIDFAWVANPRYEVTTANHNGVEIEILMNPEHCSSTSRYLSAVEQSLDYLSTHVGPYVYPKITVVDPPMHTLNSGFMEYPMLITCATSYGAPKGLRSVESLVIHEFAHQYFMATLASNEKEEAWLDEGFVTYYEDRILDDNYGAQEAYFNLLGYKSGNAQQSRNEYVSLRNPANGIIARPGWKFKGPFKPIIYAKTATALKTFENYVGRDIMDKFVQKYYRELKFTHPKEADMRGIMQKVLDSNQVKFDADKYWDQILHDTVYLDYQINDIQEHSVTVERLGSMLLDSEVEVTFEDGTSEIVALIADERSTYKFDFSNKKRIVKAQVDPKQKIWLDLNWNNNSHVLEADKKPLYKYAAKLGHWLQTAGELTSFLF